MAKLKIEGLGELQKGLRKKASLDLVKQTVKLNTMEMKDKIHDNAVFTRGYSTGDTQRSVSYSIQVLLVLPVLRCTMMNMWKKELALWMRNPLFALLMKNRRRNSKAICGNL